jgi:hypothetical protein
VAKAKALDAAGWIGTRCCLCPVSCSCLRHVRNCGPPWHLGQWPPATSSQPPVASRRFVGKKARPARTQRVGLELVIAAMCPVAVSQVAEHQLVQQIKSFWQLRRPRPRPRTCTRTCRSCGCGPVPRGSQAQGAYYEMPMSRSKQTMSRSRRRGMQLATAEGSSVVLLFVVGSLFG